MSASRSRLRTVGIAVVALLVLLAALSPTLLFGRGVSALDLILTAAGLLGVGLLLRRGGAADARTLGTFLSIIGAVLLVLSVSLAILLIAGAFSGY